MLFILASTSEIKVKAVKVAVNDPFGDENNTIHSVCPLTTVKQPLGMEQGFHLCEDRLIQALELSKEKTIIHQEFTIIAVESFVFTIRQKLHDQAWVMLRKYTRNDDNNLTFVTRCVTSCSLPLPFEPKFKLEENKTYGDVLKERGIVENGSDPHISLCGRSRTVFLAEAINVALLFFVNI
jgi:non-canonical (house-cleaning) NTP pyrophosphatase